MLLPAFCQLVPPPAAYFPAKESRQSSPGCGPDPGAGGGGIDTEHANPLAVTRRLSLRPQYFGRTVRPLGRISPLQNLWLVKLLAVGKSAVDTAGEALGGEEKEK